MIDKYALQIMLYCPSDFAISVPKVLWPRVFGNTQQRHLDARGCLDSKIKEFSYKVHGAKQKNGLRGIFRGAQS
jgi:hypothetical protein